MTTALWHPMLALGVVAETAKAHVEDAEDFWTMLDSRPLQEKPPVAPIAVDEQDHMSTSAGKRA